MRYILPIMILTLIISSCHEDIESTSLPEFEVEVIGRGLDCSDLFVVKILTNQTQFHREVNTNAFNEAYILNLEETYKISGFRMRVKLQKSNETNELVACTTMGPGYPQVKITEITEILNCEELNSTPCECYENYDPVCGCNGKTYPNSCYAECRGITIYKLGECQ